MFYWGENAFGKICRIGCSLFCAYLKAAQQLHININVFAGWFLSGDYDAESSNTVPHEFAL